MDLSGTYVIDIESSGLLEDMFDHTEFPYKLKPDSKLWCVVIRNVKTGEAVSATGDDITKEWMSKALENCTILIAHHGIKFDFPVLRLFGVLDYKVAYPEEKYSKVFDKDVLIVDTHVWSRLFNPDRLGGHSLETWGERLGYPKIDWRGEAVKLGLIQHNSPQGAEFKQYHPNMLTYCEQDTTVNMHVFLDLIKELDYKGWSQAIRLETKLADLAVNRETLGFYFDTEAANICLEDLNQKLEDLYNKVTPLLPPRPMNAGERNTHTPPKRQLTAKGEPTSYLKRFAEAMDVVLWEDEGQWYFGGYELPMSEEPIRTTLPATIDDGDWVKMFLISLGWVPTEWKERDLTKNSKKQNLPYQKRVEALGRWFKETTEGKYKKQRLAILGLAEQEVLPKLTKRLKDDRPVRVPTSPCVRVGVEKDLCPNLVELGDKVAFAKDFALYLTYKHRRTSISGGDMDEDGEPTKGFLSQVRSEDNRIPTPAIEIGASTNRYRHVGVANIPRASSVYGKEMRSLFGCGEGFLQLGYDFSSLEGRIEGQYCYVYPEGPEYSETLIAEKPNDIHSVNARKLGIPRDAAKSIKYGITYGAQPPKIAKMLNKEVAEGEVLFNGFWDAAPALKALKTDVERDWVQTGKTYITGIDGRKIRTRSQHSLLNALFQSAGVIAAKYTTVYSFQMLEERGYCISPFDGKPDVCSMIEYHDEAQIAVKSGLIKFQTFDSEEEAEAFVENYKGGQLSSIAQGKKWFVALPNDVSKAIDKAIKKTCELLKLNVPLGFEWTVGKNWYDCH